jgi:hypothetical protein
VKSRMIFDRVYESNTPDAVTITVVEDVGEAEAFVTCPTEVSGQLYSDLIGELVHVPLAIEVAIEVSKRSGMDRIVVLIDNVGLWQPEWGTLRY